VNMLSKLLMLSILMSRISFADEVAIRQLLQGVLNQAPDVPVPQPEELGSSLNENAMLSLEPGQVTNLLPLARKCLESSRLDVRRVGLSAILGIRFRSDSTALLRPYLGDLEMIAASPTDPLKRGALYILGSTNPKPSQEAISFLSGRLAAKADLPPETLMIAAAILRAAPEDSALVHKTLVAVRAQSDTRVQIGVLAQLGLIKTRNSEALDFIATSLDSHDPFVRRAAVDSVDRLDSDTKATFFDRLQSIAADPNESQEIRSEAKAALAR
jgi:hypothetical protein